MLVEEQFGRSTNALSWHIPSAYNVLASGTPEQIDRYLRPALRGELHDAYAVTEAGAGSDPSGIETTAVRGDGGWVINGEKWFVTYGDVAAVYIVVAQTDDGPTLFLVDRSATASRSSTTRRSRTPIRTGIRRSDSTTWSSATTRWSAASARATTLQREWFTEERIGIAARGVGAMWRLLEEAVAWALAREQGGARIMDYQGVSFPLADCAADAAAGRALDARGRAAGRRGGRPEDRARQGVDGEAVRVRGRLPVRRPRVQVFGGRGYMRTNVAERFLRELRVDRIWEGTSEIQRLIVARALERRGVERTLH